MIHPLDSLIVKSRRNVGGTLTRCAGRVSRPLGIRFDEKPTMIPALAECVPSVIRVSSSKLELIQGSLEGA
jgi:hypothetical protein